MDQELKNAAVKVYNTMVGALRANDWNFDEHPEDLTIVSGYRGEDLPIEYIISIDAQREVIRFVSYMPFVVPEDKRVDMSIAVNIANLGMVNGSFDYDINEGRISFRLTTSFCGCEVGEKFFMDMMSTALVTTDHYNDRFFMLSKGAITLKKFLEMEKG